MDFVLESTAGDALSLDHIHGNLSHTKQDFSTNNLFN
jgi:hypothetical protein